MSDVGRPRERLVVVLAVGVFVAWCALYVWRTSFDIDGHRVFLLWDDAMVSMRFAKNVATGHGLTWNPDAADSDRVQGFSNPLVTLVMAGMHLLPIGAERISVLFQGLNVALVIATAYVTRDLARALSGERTVGNIAGLGVLLNASLAILSLQGTDVGANAFLVTAALRSAVRGLDAEKRVPAATFVFLGLAVFVRPDAIVPLVAIAAFASSIERRPRPLVFGTVAGVVTLGGLSAFGVLYYGDPLPNTFYLKASGVPRLAMLANGVSQTLVSVRGMAFPLVVAVIGSLAFHRRDPRVRLIAVSASSIALYSTWVGGDWIAEYTGRFIAPVLPSVLVLFEVALWSLVTRVSIVGDDAKALRLGPSRQRDLFVLGSFLGAMQLSTSTALVEWLTPSQPTMHFADNVTNYRLGTYVHARTADGTSLALRWAGTAAYFAERPAIDVLGKSDRHIAHLVVDRFAPGHSKWDWDYVVNERKPDIVQGDDRGLGEREDFRRLYRGVTKGPLGTAPCFFLRAESASKLVDPDARLVEIP